MKYLKKGFQFILIFSAASLMLTIAFCFLYNTLNIVNFFWPVYYSSFVFAIFISFYFRKLNLSVWAILGLILLCFFLFITADYMLVRTIENMSK